MINHIVTELLREIEQRDQCTAAHTWRVVLYTRALAEEFGIGRERLRSLTHGAALHDIGKLDIPEEILGKPGALTDEEYEVVKLHTVAGYGRMMEMGVEDEDVLTLIKYHHERWNGHGYPFMLKGDEIPVAARLFSVVDTFDALTSKRPYREVVEDDAAERAIELIVESSGERYWPEAVAAFTELWQRGGLGWIMDHYADHAERRKFNEATIGGVRRRRSTDLTKANTNTDSEVTKSSGFTPGDSSLAA